MRCCYVSLSVVKKVGMPVTYEYDLITEKDTTVNETAMARATANTISIVAQMIGNGTITKRGVHPPKISCRVNCILKR